ncbi:hypothetical protein [Zhongshania sp.]|jgi:hypothetical protein|uniref:hypothetical protein n=1 Tax=Zhongshania sp. TaxID=1971902 RepID=UPI0039E25C21
MTDQIKRAEVAIGEHNSEDWQIQPRRFPQQLEADTPQLADFLSDSLYVEKAKQFEHADQLAVDYQSRYKKRAQDASNGIFVAAIATALLSIIAADPMATIWPNLDFKLVNEIISLIAGFVIFVASGFFVFNSQMISQLKLYDNWMENRAKAETVRLVYFRKAAQNLINQQTDNKQLLHEFCSFFRRYQLQVQQTYYRGRSQQHAKSLLKTAKYGAIAAVIVTAFSGSSGFAGFFNLDLVSFAALGTMGVALTALASRRESINQDERNSMRYKITANVLDKIAEKYSTVQKTLANDQDAVILLHFVDAVHEQLSLEHRQWTEDVAEINTALSQLKTAEKTNA